MATRIAVPSTAPTWRKAALTALAVAKRSSGTSRTAAEPRVGKVTPKEALKAEITASATELSGRTENAHITVRLQGRDSG
jgi:hypothetical protein